jgi:Putative neutral zinc metallopeptidase
MLGRTSLLWITLTLAACGSSSTGHATSSSSTSTRAVQARAELGAVRHLPRIHRGLRPRINGLQGLPLTQKLQTIAGNVASFWAYEFRGSRVQLTPATVNLVDQTPVTCNGNQVAGTDPPTYCPADGSIDLPVGFIQSKIAPIGDAAVALTVSDLYGYHIENTLGAFSPSSGLTPAQLEDMDSCFSGAYFYSLEQSLTASDETAINRLIAASASASGTGAGPGTVTAADLTAAFNKGLLANGNAAACLPARSATSGTGTSSSTGTGTSSSTGTGTSSSTGTGTT